MDGRKELFRDSKDAKTRGNILDKIFLWDNFKMQSINKMQSMNRITN